MQQVEYVNALLASLENLGAISSNYGIYDVKPFKDWKNTPWRDKIFSMRLCNAGEVLDIDKMAFNENTDTKIQQLKFEILIRSILSIDGGALITLEDLQKYNETHKSDLSQLEILRIWIRNLEQVVLDRLDGVYGGLQLKQIRLLNGVKMCATCAQEFSVVPEGSAILKYDLTEIICPSCLSSTDMSMFDVVVEKPVTEKIEIPLTQVIPPAYKCNSCEEEFDILEKYTEHIQTCAAATAVHT